MPITWKKSSRFAPAVVLARISKSRTLNPNGEGASFAGWDLGQNLPTLHSMLKFPPVARDMDQQILVLHGIARTPGELSPENFLDQINKELRKILSTKEAKYHVLTAISLLSTGTAMTVTREDVTLKFLPGPYPKKFRDPRKEDLQSKGPRFSEAPSTYTRVIATVIAKNPTLAMNRALRAVDLERAFWCLSCNAVMEIFGESWNPINAIQLGPVHTVHTAEGKSAGDNIWFELHHAPANPQNPRARAAIRKQAQAYFRRLRKCPYREAVVEALLMFVRALDEANQTTAFTKLWAGIERLASPDHGDYAAVVRRCAFLWNDTPFHVQTLEHLREYRNNCVHGASDSTSAKTHCYQLQQYFKALVHFHLRNGPDFSTLDDANAFLDLPAEPERLDRLALNIQRARRFRAPARNFKPD